MQIKRRHEGGREKITMNTMNESSLDQLSGEMLLLTAIFGDAQTRTLIDRELDRRANPMRSRDDRSSRTVAEVAGVWHTAA